MSEGPKVGYLAYENKNYKIEVGMPPATPDFPNPFPVYLIINKSSGVTEMFHQVLFYAKNWADQFNDLMEGRDPDPEKIVDSQAQQTFKFN